MRNKQFWLQNEENWQSNFMISKNDNAYLRPGTDVGLIGTRKAAIFQPVDEEKARKLPATA